MKKLLLSLLTLCLAFAFSSCEKEGEFHPKQKISKIFVQQQNQGKQLTQRWTWDGKKLMKITNGNATFFYSMKYEKNRLVRITDSDDWLYSFKYDGSTLTHLDISINGTMLASYKIEHKKNKVSKITIEEFDNLSSKGKQLSIPLLFVMPSQSIETLLQLQKKSAGSKAESVFTTFEYSWDGGNIKSASVSRTVNGQVQDQEISYKYDKKHNPLYYCFAYGNIPAANLSKNNVSEEEVLASGNTMTSENSFLYDKKDFPTEITTVIRFSINGQSGNTTSTTFYDYED